MDIPKIQPMSSRATIAAIIALSCLLGGYYLGKSSVVSPTAVKKLAAKKIKSRKATFVKSLAEPRISKPEVKIEIQKVKEVISSPPVENSNPFSKDAIGKLQTETIAHLFTDFSSKMASLSQTDLSSLDNMADELISRDPDTYAAYKAKLVVNLIRETKFNENISDSLYESLLDELSQFDVVDSDYALNEESEIIDIENTLDDLEDRLDALDENDPAGEEILAEIQKQESLLETGVLTDDDMIDDDIVKIPFYRMLAKGDHDSLIDEADLYIGEYPDSSIGYFFKAQGLWRIGEQAEAIAAIKGYEGDSKKTGDIAAMLRSSADQKPLDMISSIRIGPPHL